MLQQLTTVEKKDLPKWVESFNCSKEPPNWRAVSDGDYSLSDFFIYGFSHSLYVQFQAKNGKWFSGHLYFTLDRQEGIAIDRQYENGKFKIQFYSFAACIHEWKEVGRQGMEEMAKKFPSLKGQGTFGNCCHNSVCIKCGDYRFTDSSD